MNWISRKEANEKLKSKFSTSLYSRSSFFLKVIVVFFFFLKRPALILTLVDCVDSGWKFSLLLVEIFQLTPY